MADDPLQAIRDDLGVEDSRLMREIIGSLVAGASVDEATMRARASLAYTAVREIRPSVAKMVADGVAPGTIRRRMLAVFDDLAWLPENREFLLAITTRALDVELGSITDR